MNEISRLTNLENWYQIKPAFLRLCSISRSLTSLAARIALVSHPCTVLAAAHLFRPAIVLGPVEGIVRQTLRPIGSYQTFMNDNRKPI